MPPAVHDGHADVVDQLLFDQLRAVVDRVEHFADRDRRRRVLADGAERRLVLRRDRILEPEQAVRLEALAQPRGFDRRQAVVHVVEQVDVEPDLAPKAVEQRWHEVQVALRAPHALERHPLLRRLVVEGAAADAVGVDHAGNRALRAHRLVAHGDVFLHRLHGVVFGRAVGVAVDHHRVARRAAEQLIDRRVQRLAANVPERRVHGADRGHRHRPAPPVRALVEVLPDVLDAPRVAADEQRHHVVGEVARHRELAAVERRIAEAVDAVFGLELERDEVPARGCRR